MATLDRRHFLSTTMAALPALTAAGAAEKPMEKIVLGIVGVHGRGRDLLRGFSALEGVEIGAVCDPDENVIGKALEGIHSRQKRRPTVVQDLRKVFDDKEIQGVVIATPDHWHALATVWACQAGKDVYVEKPVSHNLIEGRRMVEAARKYNRIVQVGTQRRSGEHLAQAGEFLRGGKLGKIPFARAWIAGNRKSIGHKLDSKVPAGVDYDLWLGPAAEAPFNPNRFHYNWHWNWNFGTGELGNNGIHGLDLIRWLLGLDAPVRITSGGGKHFYDDDQQTPDTQVATFDFAHVTVIWEHRIWSKTGLRNDPFGIEIQGEKGTMVFDKNGWHVEDGIEAAAKATELEKPHLRNFLDCLRTRQRPRADIEEGHKSTRLCHLGNIAYRLSRTLRFDAVSETIPGDADANKLLGRTYRKSFVLPERV